MRINDNLEKRRIFSYEELITVETRENNEPLVDARKYDCKIVTEPEQPEMFRYTGKKILVRDTVAQCLAGANAALGGEFNLRVVFGYRHPDIQRSYFERERAKVKAQNPGLTEAQVDALTHGLIAVPEVAGHPKGAAVDLTLMRSTGEVLDMGTKIADFYRTELLPTFARQVSTEQMRNRLLLHDAMVLAGFAPFYGEWWHFSYGDPEWAAFYDKPYAIYENCQVPQPKPNPNNY